MPRRFSLHACLGELATAAIALATTGLAAPRAAAAAPPTAASPPAAATPRPLSLREAVTLARRDAPAVRAAFARIAAADARVSAARAPGLPAIAAYGSGDVYYSRGTFFTGGLGSASNDQLLLTADGSVELRWLITDFGKTTRATTSASLGLDAAREEARAQELTAAAQAAGAYYVVVAGDELNEAARRTVAQRERQLATTRALVAAGVRSPIDLTRAEVALDSAKLDFIASEATARRDASVLAAALALDPAAPVAVTRPPTFEVDDDPVRVEDAAIRNNPTVLAYTRRVEAARAFANSASAGRYPSLQGRATTGAQALRGPDTALTASDSSMRAGATLLLTVPLFDPLINAQVKTADAALGIADADLAQQALLVRADAARAALELRLARSVLLQAERVALGAQANLAAVEARYERGLLSPLEILDAQGVDAAARVAIVRARRDADVAKVRLLALTGRVLELGQSR